MKNETLFIKKANISETKVGTSDITPCANGEVIFKIERFALTTNNITYAVTGFQLKYWDFFPAEDGWGIIPCWGFAKVIQSKNESVSEGEIVYGYFPMSEYLKIEAGNITGHSFTDISEHRVALAPIYNTYNRLGTEIKYPKEVQDYVPIIQPLFATSFLNYHFIKSEQFFETKNVILTSASSKTALGIAHMYHQNKAEDKKKIIGLTSKRNIEFVEQSGFYDQVFSYDEVPQSLEDIPSILIDLAGNGKLLSAVYKALGEQMKFISKIGLTDWSAGSLDNNIPVAKFFFAPTFAQAFFEEHGAKVANGMIVKSLFQFIETAKNWIEIESIDSYSKVEQLYLEMLGGKVNPSKGYIVHA